jgi:phosphocarrier protein
MIAKELTIVNRLGLHARAAGALVKLASSFQSSITIERDGTAVNAKSIMGLLMLAAAMGTVIRVSAEGADEEEAVTAVADLIGRKFDEE